MNVRAALGWGALLAAVAGSFVLLALAGGGPAPVAATLPPLPRYRLEGVSLARWNARGLLRYRLHARTLVRWRTRETLAGIRFHDRPERPGTTLVLARHGERHDPGHRLLLWGHVRILYRHTPGGPPVRLATSRLWIDTRTERASTRQAVVIREGTSRVDGVGLRARLDARRVRLLADVRAILYPHDTASPPSAADPASVAAPARPGRPGASPSAGRPGRARPPAAR